MAWTPAIGRKIIINVDIVVFNLRKNPRGPHIDRSAPDGHDYTARQTSPSLSVSQLLTTAFRTRVRGASSKEVFPDACDTNAARYGATLFPPHAADGISIRRSTPWRLHGRQVHYYYCCCRYYNYIMILI